MVFVCFVTLDGAKAAALGGGALATWVEFLLNVLKLD